MNESDFENELRKIRPAAPSAGLEQAITRELALPAPSRHPHRLSGEIIRPRESRLSRLLFGLCWATGGATAAIVVMSALNPHPASSSVAQAPTAPAIENVFEPAETSREVLAAEDDGLIYDEEEEPARVVRYDSVERYVWANPATGARVEVEMPREDIVLVPVSFQ